MRKRRSSKSGSSQNLAPAGFTRWWFQTDLNRIFASRQLFGQWSVFPNKQTRLSTGLLRRSSILLTLNDRKTALLRGSLTHPTCAAVHDWPENHANVGQAQDTTR